MSPLDVLAELRETRPAAPPELRERVRAVAAAPAPQRSRLTWRRAVLVLVPALLALVAGSVVTGRGERTATPDRPTTVPGLNATAEATKQAPQAASTAAAPRAGFDTAAPAPSRTRLQDYNATLRLRVRNAEALSDATKRAVRIATSLGGFAASVHVNVDRGEGDAVLRLRVPVSKVQLALQRLAELGTITGEAVSIQDVQPSVNATDRRMARLQRELRALRAEKRTPRVQRRLDALTAQVERLQRARAATVRQARLATIDLTLTTREAVTPPKADDGPLDGAITALKWLGIAALYVLIVGGPIVALLALAWLGWRGYRRRSERRLLERH